MLFGKGRCGFGTECVLFVDPYPPLVAVVEHDHLLAGGEHSEDVDQHLETDQHFLQQVDYLRNRQQIHLLQGQPHLLSFDPQLVKLYFTVAPNVTAYLFRYLCVLLAFVGGMDVVRVCLEDRI